MTRKDLENIAAYTDEQLEPLTVVELAALQATMRERDTARANAEAAIADAAAAHTAALAAKDTDHAAALAAMTTAHDAEAASLRDQLAATQQGAGEALAALQQQLREAQALTDALGGTELGQQMAKERQIAELSARKEASLAAVQEAEAAIAELAKV